MKKIILLSLASIVLNACSVDANKEYDVNSVSLNRTSMVQKHYDDELIPKGTLFSWSPNLKGVYQDNRLNHVNMDRLLKKSIESTLVKKGYRFTENAASAGYKVTYTAALKSALSDDEVLKIFGAQPGLVPGRKLDQKVEKGTLIVDVINQKTGHLHWRGIAQALARLDEIPQQYREQRVEQFVNFLLSDLH
ncbi:MAG: DUF4136 domain-containing protein [Methylococcales bacterium]|nr:DUF4136 domain-containing protein [Methylococcales bacterium]